MLLLLPCKGLQSQHVSMQQLPHHMGKCHLVLCMPNQAPVQQLLTRLCPCRTCMVELMTQVSRARHSLCPLSALFCPVAPALEWASQHASLLQVPAYSDFAKTSHPRAPCVAALSHSPSMLECLHMYLR